MASVIQELLRGIAEKRDVKQSIQLRRKGPFTGCQVHFCLAHNLFKGLVMHQKVWVDLCLLKMGAERHDFCLWRIFGVKVSPKPDRLHEWNGLGSGRKNFPSLKPISDLRICESVCYNNFFTEARPITWI